MSLHRKPSLAGLAAGAALVLGALPAAAQPAAPRASTSLAPADCFFSRDWQGWSSPSPDILYLQVRGRDVYRVDLLPSGSQPLDSGHSYLITQHRGSGVICAPIDLDILVADRAIGVTHRLFPTAIAKLSREEAAALPRQHRPIRSLRKG
jgi:hypothetical protein